MKISQIAGRARLGMESTAATVARRAAEGIASGGTRSTTGSGSLPPNERREHPLRPQRRQLRRRHIGDPARRAAQVAGRGEVEDLGTTGRTACPGFGSSWAAQATRVRSMTRLRLGAPPAPNCRDRCSRLTRRRRASSVGAEGPLDVAHHQLPRAPLERLGEAEHPRRRPPSARRALGGERGAAHHSPTTASSTPSTDQRGHRAARGRRASSSPSSGRNGA